MSQRLNGIPSFLILASMRQLLASVLCALVFSTVGAASPNWPQSGFGSATLPDSGQFEGYFQDGLFEGEGTIVWKDGYIYKGRFRKGLFHGYGKLTRP